jgi:signal transduction histidine kinase/ActR/RegA family two-component response regulator
LFSTGEQLENQEKEVRDLKEIISELNRRIAQNELQRENMRGMRYRLNEQLELFAQIHRFTQLAFSAPSQAQLMDVMAEGLVDIFQLEMGGVLLFGKTVKRLILSGACNFDRSQKSFAVSPEWIAKNKIGDLKTQQVLIESPPGADSPFKNLGLAHAVYLPFFNNLKKIEGFILGGISRESADIYTFMPAAISSSFLVYAQTMNGIYNNIMSIAEAKAAGEAKARFLANMSHEIRTPLNAVIGMTSIGESSRDIAKKNYAFNKIKDASTHLLGVINDILDMSKIDAGKLELAPGNFGFAAMMDKAININSFRIEEKKQQFSTRFDERIPGKLFGDDQRLIQVITNLLSNAVKFTPEQGSIRLEADLLDREDGVYTVQIKITDTGIGISREQQKRLFNAFVQADSGTSRKFGGTGLGLAISKRIVEMMGGKIRVESKLGRGTAFMFTVPLGSPEGERGAEEAADGGGAEQGADFSGRRILLVEDVEINAEIMGALLEPTGLEIDNAYNGKEAVKIFREHPGRYDLVFMDVQMPEMDGYEATRRIREFEASAGKAGRVPIVAMTANVFKEDIENCRAAGMDDHIGKPIDFNAVLEKLSHYMA